MFLIASAAAVPEGLPASAGFWMPLVAGACLIAALVMDRRWGEPSSRWHPVVWMGKYLEVCGQFASRCRPAAAFAAGAVAWCVGAMAVAAPAWLIHVFAVREAVAAASLIGSSAGTAHGVVFVTLLALVSWFFKTTFSWRMLREETMAVESALQHSLEAGRRRLAFLVSRNTAELTAVEVRESAIESLAENLNDSVIAPLFWFMLFGLPGAVVYRFANTADAMWGYRGLRHGVDWEWAGKWAARADDALSWVPARITALLLSLAVCGLPFRRLSGEAVKTPSPNSGWPMAAMALGLGVRLGKPEVYVLNPDGREPAMADTLRADLLACRAVRLGTLSAFVALVAAFLITWLA